MAPKKDATELGVSDDSQVDGESQITDEGTDEDQVLDDSEPEEFKTFAQRHAANIEKHASQIDETRKAEFVYIDDSGAEIPKDEVVIDTGEESKDLKKDSDQIADDSVKTDEDKEKEAQAAQAAAEEVAKKDQAVDDPEETLIIDGKEVKVKRSELIETGRRARQKELAADRRLEEASTILKRVEDLENTVKSGAHKQAQEPSEQDAQKKDAVNTELESAKFRLEAAQTAFAKATADLDESKILEAQKNLSAVEREIWRLETQSDQKPIDVDKLTQEITQRVTTFTSVQDLNKWARRPAEEGGLKDILDDETAYRFFDTEVKYLTSVGKQDPMSQDTYVKAAKTVREFMNKPQQAEADKKAQSEAEEKQAMEARKAAKKKLDNVKPVGAKAPSKKLDDKPLTYEETVRIGREEAKKKRVGAFF